MLDPIASSYLALYPREAAHTLSRVENEELLALLEDLPADIAAGVLEHLAPGSARFCLEGLPEETAADILARMATAPAAERLRAMARPRVQTLLARLPRLSATRLRIRMRHPEGTVGSLVDTDVLTLTQDLKVSEALRLTRSSRDRVLHELYVLDDRGRLKGVAELPELLAEKDRAPITRVTHRVPYLLFARASLRSAEDHPAWSTREHLPVVDREGVFQGVLARTLLHDEERGVHPEQTDAEDLAITQRALADVLWLALSPLFGSPSEHRTRKRNHQP
jgi:magnesium transporter